MRIEIRGEYKIKDNQEGKPCTEKAHREGNFIVCRKCGYKEFA